MSTPTPTICPRCGGSLQNRSVDNLCAKCLGELNFATDTGGPESVGRDSPPPFAPAEVAALFPQFEVLELLGRGGMGVVYKARQKALGRLVALKLLAPERVADPKFAERFAHEAQALAALSHPNIVTIHDFGQVGGVYYLLMEYVDGVNLRQAIAAGRFTPEQALAIVPPVCEALQNAHEHGVVHRDIKPENLLLDKEGRVKIADFGIAKMLGTEDDTVGGDEGKQAGTLASGAGTPQYMAPEQKANRRTDHRADIYSLGVVLYELLTGELPADKLQPPSRKVQIDVRLDEIVLRALEKSPELRYQTAREFRTQLETMVSASAGSKSSRQFKTCQGMLFPPDQFTTASGQFHAYRTRGQLILDDRQLTHSRAGVNTIIPLSAIRDVSLGRYPRTQQPLGVDLISVKYEEGGQNRQILLSPMEGWFDFPSNRNALTAEWLAALREAVRSATGHEPASTPREQLGIPRDSRLTLALITAGPLCGLVVLWGCLIYLAIMRQIPGAPTTFPFNINPLGVLFALVFLFVLITCGLSWLGHRRAGKASSSAAQPDASCSSPGSIVARPRFSRIAIVGACLVAMGLLSVFLFFFVDELIARRAMPEGGVFPNPPATSAAPAMLGAVLVYAFFATLLGWISVTQIRRSAGKLDGLWLAVFDGLFFPVLALDALIFAASGAVIHLLLKSSDFSVMPVWLVLFLTGLGVFTVALVVVGDFFIIRGVWGAVSRKQTDGAGEPQSVSPRSNKTIVACVMVPCIVLTLLGVERYFNWRWEKSHWHTLRMVWSDRTKDIAGTLRITEVTREGRIVSFRIACESGPMPVDFQVSYSGQEIDSLPSADTLPNVTALYAPLLPQIASVGNLGHPGMTLHGTRWVRRLEKITLQKPGEMTLGFVLPDETRAERAMQEARRIYLPGRPCHLHESDVLMLFTQFRDVGENNREQSQAMLHVNFAVAPSQPAPVPSLPTSPTIGPPATKGTMPQPPGQ